MRQPNFSTIFDEDRNRAQNALERRTREEALGWIRSYLDELADRQDIDVVEDGRAEVRIRIERGPQAEQPLLRAHVCRVELGVPDRPLQNSDRREARVQCLLRQRRTGRTNSCGSDQPLVEHQLGGEHLERTPRFEGDLGTDPVSGEKDDSCVTRRQAPPR